VARLDHLNARIGARRARLLGAAGMRELLGRVTLESRLEALSRSAWGPDLPAGLARLDEPLAAVEAALRRALARDAAWLVRQAEGARGRALLAAYLALGEGDAVKALLRGIAAGVPPAAAAALVPPTAALGPGDLSALAESGSPEALADALASRGSPLGEALRAALPSDVAGLLPAEVAIDRAAAARAARACAGLGEDARILASHVADRVDARNAATLLALGGAGGGEALFVAGGRRLDGAEFARLASASGADLREGLAAAFPGAAAGLARPWSADRALERALLAPLRRGARASPLSIAVPLAWLAERTAEARRIALVLRGAALGLPGEEILDLAEA